MLRDPQTPNETKLKGFAQVLLDEWSKGTFFGLMLYRTRATITRS